MLHRVLLGLALVLEIACGGSASRPVDVGAVLDVGAGGGGQSGGTGGGAGGMGGGGGCPLSPRPCYYYGDGRLDPGEDCDDGNLAYGDGCNAIGKVEPNWVCPFGQNCHRLSECGDGILGPDEICDDGLVNRSSGHGCSADCQSIEPGWYCPFVGRPCMRTGVQPGQAASCDAGECPPSCGNGIVEAEEECDLGLALDDQAYGGCNTKCRLGPRCGDGMVNGDEKCDMGSENGIARGDAGPECTRVCKPPVVHVCGDGTTDPELGEACDLGELNGGIDMPCGRDCQIVFVSCLGMCI